MTEGGSDGAAKHSANESAERLPPSALPGISPSKGEIGKTLRLRPQAVAHSSQNRFPLPRHML
ncbi:hypothetical protein F4V91_04805 [Neorhizobium galegae]|uniref:Uncharacterized protein n=1 Tax=Neorhizobium galegae TaxID=399 RepID=A0A6A1TNL1_NEOGA|nr:hypothetical protein F4V91_04805 [Neorhizobium galegae]